MDPRGYFQTEPDGLAPNDLNTIICNGSGGIMPHISPDINPDRLRCGVRGCQIQHEMSHIADALKANPSVCMTRFGPKPFGTLVRPSSVEEKLIGEIEGYKIEGECLSKLLQDASCDCKDVLQAELGGVDAKRSEYRTKLYNLRRR